MSIPLKRLLILSLLSVATIGAAAQHAQSPGSSAYLTHHCTVGGHDITNAIEPILDTLPMRDRYAYSASDSIVSPTSESTRITNHTSFMVPSNRDSGRILYGHIAQVDRHLYAYLNCEEWSIPTILSSRFKP